MSFITLSGRFRNKAEDGECWDWENLDEVTGMTLNQASSTGTSASQGAEASSQLPGRRSCHDQLYRQPLCPGLDPGEASCGLSSPGLALV